MGYAPSQAHLSFSYNSFHTFPYCQEITNESRWDRFVTLLDRVVNPREYRWTSLKFFAGSDVVVGSDVVQIKVPGEVDKSS